MTDDEIEIETLRYRAPVVVPLSGGRLAVLTPGWEPEWQLCNPIEVEGTLRAYIEWNVLPETKHVPKAGAATTDMLAALGLEIDEMDEVLNTLIEKRTK